MPSFNQNIKHLKGFIPRAAKRNVEHVKKLIDLYEQRKIPYYKSVENAVIKLAHPSLGTKGEDQRLYTNLVSKYEDARPLHSRLERETHRIEEKLKRKHTGTYSIKVILYTEASKKDRTKPVEDTLTPEQEEKYSKYTQKGIPRI
jgi:hypothetical protein